MFVIEGHLDPELNKHCKLENIEKLVEQGANVNSHNKYNNTSVLQRAALQDREDKKEIIDYLLEQGANINDHFICGFSLLDNLVTKACTDSDLDIIIYLHSKGAKCVKCNDLLKLVLAMEK